MVVYAAVVVGCYALFIPIVTGLAAQVACAVFYTVAVAAVILLGVVTRYASAPVSHCFQACGGQSRAIHV